MVAVGERLPERRQVAGTVRVDDRQILWRDDLHQAEFGPKRIFGNEFRINSNSVGAGQPPA